MALIIIVAFILDCIIGDPQHPLHPISIIGKGIALGVKAYKRTGIKKPSAQFFMGVILTLAVVGLSYGAVRLVLWGAYYINGWLGFAVESVLCCFLIAPKTLKRESLRVYRALDAGDIDMARKELARIVGRDTHNLDKRGVVKAAVETVAENLSDGVIAPLFFICVGGAPLGAAYKAINTLDSMIGYKDDDFMYFGKFAARLDDVVNFIPARVSALLMLSASAFTGADAKRAARVYKRDRYNHKSPNSAQTESVCAGALGLRLGGDAYYHGALVSKPTIGDDIREPMPEHILAANRLMYAATACAVALFAALSFLWGYGAAYV